MRIVAIGLLLILLAPARVRGADAYPSLYRGIAREDGLHLLAHFSPSFLSMGPAEQERYFRDAQSGIESLQTLKKSNPRIVEPKSLDLLVKDRPGDLYYVVVGIRIYQARAKGLRLREVPLRCGRRLTVEVNADWVVPSPPLEKEGPPPFLEADSDPDGVLIFKGGGFNLPIEEFHQTKFQQVRFPEDLPEGLKARFPEELAHSDAVDALDPVLLYAPAIGFMSIEVALWKKNLPENTILQFFYQTKEKWNEVPFTFAPMPRRHFSSRVISRFDLNRNGLMEYLVELRDDLHTRRMVYELDEKRNEASVMTVAEDTVVIPNTADPQCGEGETGAPLHRKVPIEAAPPSPSREGP
ncbi:MAG TPA: hypothetical protein VFG95_03795 [Nitrospiria bacterium]|nr:hypothetical protein [Nitrospiria bacterium]